MKKITLINFTFSGIYTGSAQKSIELVGLINKIHVVV